MYLLFLVIYCLFLLLNSSFSSSSNTFVFSAGPNSYVAFDSWRPCLNGYVRFDIRTSAPDGTLAYIDDRGKFDFFYLKLIEGKLRLLFNLGNDRQALNVNMHINDDQWHTILIKRDGQTTVLSIDYGRASNSTVTHSEDLYFGGSTHQEYQASPFYFGGIPAILERPSSGNLSSFDVYMQPRFRGRLRNVVYKNCSNSRLVQPVHLQISGGVSLIPSHFCSSQTCGQGICLITDTNSQCLCDETDYQGTHCELERQPNELTFNGKKSLKYTFNQTISSANEMIQFQFKTNHYDALLFQLVPNEIFIKLKSGQLVIEYRLNNQWYESSTKDLYLIDNQWHYVQIKRQHGQITMMLDEYHLQLENEMKIDQRYSFKEIDLGGSVEENSEKFYGCLKDVFMTFNENLTVDLSKYFLSLSNNDKPLRCSSLLNPIEFLISSSYLSFNLSEPFRQMLNYQLTLSFHFQTYSADAILLYFNNHQTHGQDFLGLDLIDGFFYITINFNQKQHRQELFHQRFNDGQTHLVFLHIQGYQGGLEFNITMDYRQNTRIMQRNSYSKIHLQTLTIGGISPSMRGLPKNFWSGIMHRGLIGCFSDLELNNEAINLTKYINQTNNNITPKSGPCSMVVPSKQECSCEHDGECRLNQGGTWSCDCSKTGYTGRRCEHPTYYVDLKPIQIFEFDTNMQWSEQINDIAFGLQAIHDQENFLQVRPCRSTITPCDSIDFSIRNGLLDIHFHLSNFTLNLTGEYPFLLDNQWHYIHLYRIDTKLLLHIDHHIAQQRFPVVEYNQTSFETIWLIFHGNKQIRLENVRLYDQSINSQFFLNEQYEQIQLKQRPWQAKNSIAFTEQDSYIEIQLNDLLCQECQLETIYFDFRTTELTGLILFANIQTINPKLSYSLEDDFAKDSQYLIIKLVDGQLHLIVLIASMNEDEDEIYQIQTQTRLNDGQWHHLSLQRVRNHHLELILDSQVYYLLISIHFLETIYFGRPTFLTSDTLPFNHISTLKTCLSSLTLNSRSVNLRDYIKNSNSPSIRPDCFHESQCPLRYCQNTGQCQQGVQCNCEHTSFQGEFCTELKSGYFFNEYTSGLIFDQPYQMEKKFVNYQISFGIVTKMSTGEIIRVSDQIQIELHRGHLQIKLAGNNQNENDEFLQSNLVINDGQYHLVQIEYNQTGNLRLTVDKVEIVKELNHRLAFEKPLLLLIGQNPAFKHGFQGQLYGLQSDIYSVFDMIAPTFQRLSYSPVQDKAFTLSYSSPALLHPPNQSENDLIPSLCSSQSYDNICLVPSNTTSSPLSYPNITFLTSLPKNRTTSSSSTTRYTSRSTRSSSTSTTSPRELNSSSLHHSNATHNPDLPPLIVSIRTPLSSRVRKIFHYKYIWVIVVPLLCGIVLCILMALIAYINYRRKDVGVYEVEEAQRFRPLIVELTPSPGDQQQENVNSTTVTNSLMNLPTTKKDSQKRKPKRKKTPLNPNDEQREFYI